MDPIFGGALIAISMLLILGIPALIAIGVALLIFTLAGQNMFWTFVQEANAKAVMAGKRFEKLLMSFNGRNFKGLPPKTNAGDLNQWEVFENKDYKLEPELYIARVFPFLRGLKWVGIWPFIQVYEYRFTWTSREQVKNPVTGLTETRLVTTEKYLDSILLQADTYAFIIVSVGTKEAVPLDIEVNFLAQVTNPYKALFEINHWLETSINQMTGQIRPYIGQLSFKEVNSFIKDKKLGEVEEEEKSLDKHMEALLKIIHEKYGVEISNVMIVEASPNSQEATDAITAQAKVFVANQEAEAMGIIAEAQMKRAEKYYTTVSNIPGGPGMLAVEALRDSDITTYAPSGEGRALLPVIDVSVQKKGENQ